MEDGEMPEDEVIPNQHKRHHQQQHTIPINSIHLLPRSKEKRRDKAIIKFNCTGRKANTIRPWCNNSRYGILPDSASADRDDR
jgi:hypothetical protein